MGRATEGGEVLACAGGEAAPCPLLKSAKAAGLVLPEITEDPDPRSIRILQARFIQQMEIKIRAGGRLLKPHEIRFLSEEQKQKRCSRLAL